MRNTYAKYALILGLCLGLFSCAKNKIDLPFYLRADFTPTWAKYVRGSFHQIPPFSLTTAQDTAFSEQNLKGHWSVVQFFFSRCPNVCIRITQNLETALPKLSQWPDVQIVSISLDPEFDSPSVLAQASSDKPPKNWIFLTGDKQRITELAREGFFLQETLNSPSPDKGRMHSELIFLVDPDLHVRGVYNGQSPLDMAQLIEDLEKGHKTRL